ncbi:unnamed protein product [Coffea canephora]|uniref:Uncharacterized protein n=1 Tax=Coffea canephora TaxID=49390 RepID=A0A068UQ22_COFCA|nr:unnamed protein product [Coffea canephora]
MYYQKRLIGCDDAMVTILVFHCKDPEFFDKVNFSIEPVSWLGIATVPEPLVLVFQRSRIRIA